MRLSHNYYNIDNELLPDDVKKKENEFFNSLQMQFITNNNGRVLPGACNRAISATLIDKGWEREYLYPENVRGKADFYTRTASGYNLYAEIEFGHRNSIDHDLLKFYQTYKTLNNDNCLFILVVPGTELAKKIGDSVSNRHYAESLFDNCNALGVPILLVSIIPSEDNPLDYLLLSDLKPVLNPEGMDLDDKSLVKKTKGFRHAISGSDNRKE